MDVLFGIGLTWTPWRIPYENFKWKKEIAKKLQKDINDIKPTKESGLEKFNVLTIGIYGHGKSSLINTFASISVGEKTTICNAASTDTNVTTHSEHQKAATSEILIHGVNVMKYKRWTKYRNFVFPGTLGQIVLSDISGLPVKKDVHPTVENIKLILHGHIKNRYKFHPDSIISSEDENYKSKPTFSDRIHCAMIVIDSTMAYELPARFVYDVKTIMETMHSMNIPMIAVLTKTDKLSEHVKYSVESIFRCRKVQQAVEKISTRNSSPKDISCYHL